MLQMLVMQETEGAQSIDRIDRHHSTDRTVETTSQFRIPRNLLVFPVLPCRIQFKQVIVHIYVHLSDQFTDKYTDYSIIIIIIMIILQKLKFIVVFFLSS